MTEDKLTNEEISRVFAMYWDSEIFIQGLNESYKVSSRTIDSFEHTVYKDQYKLLLTDLKDITDEHANEVVRVLRIDEKEAGFDTNGAAIKNCLAKDGFYALSLFDFYGTGADSYEYLKSKGYAVPLWFGIDHWANGKTAIELQIAIKK